MILSNVEIQKALDDGRLIIDPRPQPKSYDTTAIDLHLSSSLSIPREGAFNYDLRRGGIAATLARNSDHLEIPVGGHVLERSRFVLGITREKVGLPLVPDGTLAARIEGKSSLARCGLLIHFTAPTVHAGWDGPLVLEMINLGATGITLFPDMAIAQLILEVVSGNVEPNPSQFYRQATPAGTTNK